MHIHEIDIRDEDQPTYVWHRLSAGRYYNGSEDGTMVIEIRRQQPDFGKGEPSPIEWVVIEISRWSWERGEDEGRAASYLSTLREAKVWAERAYLGVSQPEGRRPTITRSTDQGHGVRKAAVA